MKKMQKRIVSFILAGTMAATMTGCSKNEKDTDGVIVKSSTGFYCRHQNQLEDWKFNFSKNYDEGEKEVKYDFLIDYRNTIDNRNYATFGKIVEELHISRLRNKGYKAYSAATFTGGYFQTIILPDTYRLYGSTKYLKAITGNDTKIDLYKIHALDYNDVYYVKEQMVMGKNIERVNSRKYCIVSEDDFELLKEGDTMVCETLFKCNDKGEIEILARRQSGVGANCDNVASKNVGNIDESIKNLDETLFSCLSGQISEESYVLEALDTYSDANNFFSPENKGIDFSKFKK